mmetsp:Transcript_4821/g.9552  ORF Transcript_4821/g.9552 Transcript_4821/m.9552 type:complete len:295 (-) Transcript_4821:848-1732(-)
MRDCNLKVIDTSNTSSAVIACSRNQRRPDENFIAGMLGGSVSTALLFPLDLIKVRMQVNETLVSSTCKKMGRYDRSIISSFRSIIRYEGVRGLYGGLTPSLAGSGMSWGGYFYFYERIKGAMVHHRNERGKLRGAGENGIKGKESLHLGPLDHFAASCAAGAVMVIFTNPIWLIKTRMQLQVRTVAIVGDGSRGRHKLHDPALNKVRPYSGMFDAIQTIVKEEGILAMYKGALPAMMLTTHGGVQFVSYEFLKRNISSSNGDLFYKRQRNKKRTAMQYMYDSLGYICMGAVSKM